VLTTRRQQGMTLIEAMIGMSLAVILVAMAIPSFRTGFQNREIRSTADAIQNGLQVARTEALRRNRNVRFTLQDGWGWSVGCDPVDTTVEGGEQICPETLQVRAPSPSPRVQVQVDRRDIATGTVDGTIADRSLKLNAMGRTTTDTLPAGKAAVFRLTLPAGGACAADGGEMRCLNVIVTATGQIRMCDPAASAGDPRAC
jgi:type IV fimbrial biogenesis protein FimT